MLALLFVRWTPFHLKFVISEEPFEAWSIPVNNLAESLVDRQYTFWSSVNVLCELKAQANSDIRGEESYVELRFVTPTRIICVPVLGSRSKILKRSLIPGCRNPIGPDTLYILQTGGSIKKTVQFVYERCGSYFYLLLSSSLHFSETILVYWRR